jgi:hypothetical protein
MLTLGERLFGERLFGERLFGERRHLLPFHWKHRWQACREHAIESHKDT